MFLFISFSPRSDCCTKEGASEKAVGRGGVKGRRTAYTTLNAFLLHENKVGAPEAQVFE